MDIAEVNKLKSPQKTLLTIQKANYDKGIKTLNKRINPGVKISKFKELTNSLNLGKSKVDKINISAFCPYFKEKGYATLKSENSTIFIVDLAATCHVIANKNLFINYLNKTSYINWGKAKRIKVNGEGDILLYFKDTNLYKRFHNCIYMPELGINIISIPRLKQTNTLFTLNNIFLFNNKDNLLLTKGFKFQDLYKIEAEAILPSKVIFLLNKEKSNKKQVGLNTLHQRMGHINYNTLKRLPECTENLDISDIHELLKAFQVIKHCELCFKAKFYNKINKKSINENKSYKKLEKVFSDIGGLITPNTFKGYKYFITFLDKSTRYLTAYLIKYKLEALAIFK
jgi:hypothetical protein